jgi:adenylate kinase family enzyme
MNILLLGPQGSGKGTQAKLISQTYGVPHIATGDMIREMKELDTPLGHELKAVYDAGDLVDDDLMIRLIRDRLSSTGTRARWFRPRRWTSSCAGSGATSTSSSPSRSSIARRSWSGC